MKASILLIAVVAAVLLVVIGLRASGRARRQGQGSGPAGSSDGSNSIWMSTSGGDAHSHGHHGGDGGHHGAMEAAEAEVMAAAATRLTRQRPR